MSHAFPRLLARHKAALLSKRIRKICGSEVKYKKLWFDKDEDRAVFCSWLSMLDWNSFGLIKMGPGQEIVAKCSAPSHPLNL